MREQRKNHRADVFEDFAVIDQATGDTLGTLRNISSGGMMLLGPRTVKVDQPYRLTVYLPKPISGISKLELATVCKWHTYDKEHMLHKAGFKFSTLTPRDEELIVMLQTEYEFLATITER
ncbi:MAG: PilZ domain-containing protein [Candidatus Zixiibacteriota bacterium]